VFIRKEIYDSAPYYWVILGVVLIVLGTYLGVADGSDHFALGLICGVISCTWGLRVFRQRLLREARPRCPTCTENIEQA
jgi:hypothetical protein